MSADRAAVSIDTALEALSLTVVVVDESLELVESNVRYKSLVADRFGPERDDVPFVEVAAVVFGVRPFDLIDAMKVLRTGARSEVRIAAARPASPQDPLVELRMTRLGGEKSFFAISIEKRATRIPAARAASKWPNS